MSWSCYLRVLTRPGHRLSGSCAGAFFVPLKIMSKRKKVSVIPAVVVFVVLYAGLRILIGGAVCSDGWASPSIGRSGACSHHGGVRTWPYVLIFFVSLVVSSWFHFRRSQGRESDPGDEARLPQPSLGTPATAPKAPTKTENPRCSRCRSNMVLRTASRGRNAGNKFWGCSRYPQCKGTKPFKAPEQQTCPNCGSSELAQGRHRGGASSVAPTYRIQAIRAALRYNNCLMSGKPRATIHLLRRIRQLRYPDPKQITSPV